MTDVQVKIELGHRATPLSKPTKERFTHDWTVYVRGPEQYSIANFVEKVVFHLHHTFDNPKRECKEPPYHVSEQGYAGFVLPIHIYFKNKAEPRKIVFQYNLFLHTTEPVNHSRCEKLTFQNPTEEFKKKLLKAGGVLMRPAEEAQFTNLFGPPIKTTESPKKPKTPSIASKEKPPRLSLDESSSVKSASSKSKSKESSSTKSSSSSKLDSSRDDSHSSKEKSSKEKHSRKHADSPVTFSSSKRHSESPSRHDHSKKLKRSSSSSSFSDKKSKERNKEAEKERERAKEKEREKEHEREKDKEREREKEREKEREREREREKEKQKEIEKEKERQKELERERIKELEKQKEIEKEKQREAAERERQREIEREKEREKEKERERVKELEKIKQKQREKEKQRRKERKEKEKLESSSHSEKAVKKKHSSSDKQKVKENDGFENDSMKESQKKRSPSVDSEIRRREEIEREKSKVIVPNKVEKSPAHSTSSRKDGHKKHERSLPIPEKLPYKEKRAKDSKTEKVDKHKDKHESKTVQHRQKSTDFQKTKPKKATDGSSAHRHRLLSKISTQKLKDDLSLSDSSDLSSVSSLSSSSSSAGSGSSSESENESEAGSAASASRKSSTSSSKSTESTPAQKSALDRLLAEAEMEEDESEEEIAEPSSVFSNHSAGLSHSPNQPSLDTKPVFSNSQLSPSHHNSDSKSVFSNNSSKSSPIRHLVDTKLVKKERNRDKDSKKKSKVSGQDRNVKGISNSVAKQNERGSLVHSESKGFDVESNEGNITDMLYKTAADVPDSIVESPNDEDLSELVALQGKLMSIKDPNILVQVVMLIQKVGKFQIGDSTFDFDLCSLDSQTVQKIRSYLSQT